MGSPLILTLVFFVVWTADCFRALVAYEAGRFSLKTAFVLMTAMSVLAIIAAKIAAY